MAKARAERPQAAPPPPDPPILVPGQSWVYFLLAEFLGLVQIGVTTDMAARFEAIQNMSPVPLRLIHYEPGDQALERKYHLRFEEYRSHSEWFKLDGKLLKFLRKAGANFADHDA